jgi:hypothetical protein
MAVAGCHLRFAGLITAKPRRGVPPRKRCRAGGRGDRVSLRLTRRESRRQAAESIAAYADTVGKLTEAIQAGDGRQPGDPAKAAAAIRRLVAADRPPLRLPLGSDCVSLVEGKLATVAEELDRWRELALSTDFPSS